MSTIADMIEESNTRIKAIEDIMIIIEELRKDVAELKEMIRSANTTPEGTADQ
jgi:hypothetical protein